MSDKLSAVITVNKDCKDAAMLRLYTEKAVQVYFAPRVGFSAENEIKIRIIKRNNDVLIHVTAPDAAAVKKTVQQLFPDEKDLFIEFCG